MVDNVESYDDGVSDNVEFFDPRLLLSVLAVNVPASWIGGTTVSALENPFLKQMGFLKGAVGHFIVGTLCAGGATIGMTVGGLLGGVIGAVTAEAAFKARDISFDESLASSRLLMGALGGMTLGVVSGSLSGYNFGVDMVHREGDAFKAAAIEQTVPAIPAPALPANVRLASTANALPAPAIR